MSTNWKTVRVFISSTFLDMQAERNHLVRFVFPRLREELLQKRIHLVDVDLRWGVTGEQDALDVCREVIDECRPRFICLLGGRYGWIPPGRTRSITAEEVHYGVLDRALADPGQAFFYFRDEAATATMVEAFAGEFLEPDGSEKRTKLNALKQEIIGSGRQPFVYPARWDDERRVLTGLQEFGDRVYADLTHALEPELSQPSAADGEQDENGAMNACLGELTRQFVLGNRQPVLDELIGFITHRSQDGFLCLTGSAGCGKSALLAHLLQVFPRTSPVSIISHFVGTSPGSTDVRLTLRRICQELKMRFPGITAPIPDDFENLRQAFARFVSQACDQGGVAIVLDGIDGLAADDETVKFSWLPERLPGGARILLSLADGPTLELLRQHRRSLLEIRVPPLARRDEEAISRDFLRRYRKELEPGQLEALLAKNDASKPLYLVSALEEIRTLGTPEEISARIAELPGSMPELFSWILNRWQNDDGFRDGSGGRIGPRLVPEVAALLSSSRYGLSRKELIELFAHSFPSAGPSSVSDEQGNVAALLYLARPYLMNRGDLVALRYPPLRTAVEALWLATEKESREVHLRLAAYFDASAQVEPGVRFFTRRIVDELPWQLAQAGDWQALFRLLCEPAFVESACSLDRFAVLAYWSQVENYSPLRMIDGYSKDSLQNDVLVHSQVDAIASLLLEVGHLAQAKDWWDKLRIGSVFAGDKRSYAIMLERLGLIARAQNRLDEAMVNFTQAERLMREIGDWHGVSVSLGNQALIHSDKNDEESAMRLHKEEEQICRKLDDFEGLATSLGNQAVILIGKEDFKNAWILLKEQERISRELGNKNQLQLSLGNQGIVLTAWSRLKEALAVLQEAEQICRELQNPEGLARSLFNQAFIRGCRMSDRAAARRFLDEAERMISEHSQEFFAQELGERILYLRGIIK